MVEKIRISPRAKRIAEEHCLDVSAIPLNGTGFAGGICERDIRSWVETNDADAYAVRASTRSTPLARRIARIEGVDIGDVVGTGVAGKVTKADVLRVMEGSAVSPDADDAASVERAYSVPEPGTNGYKTIASVVPYEGVRKIIGEKLAMSKFTAPHLYFTQKVDLTELIQTRKSVNEKQERKTSVTDYIARACVIALQKYQEMNSSLVENRIESYANVNLGIAVASPTGLIVPVIKNAQALSVVELSKAALPLFDKAREGKLKPDEYSGGTFTISNLGMFGIENFTAIINPPEVGILAISSAKDEPVVVADASGEKTIAIRPMMNITLSVDHRLIDGLLAAQFVTEVKRLLESPIELLI
ncbi:MAG: 2-oxo acid dehydrogenase subunit E2 [Clostridiales Family XIII bacterium]|jgi:pyruvate dehydrogenase E2 component (dihydrolipoamide acetyltransferase)|nr:2-oxo acid dehydrogenase subunit E2 [Clostridiales Family XIII bacterium]